MQASQLLQNILNDLAIGTKQLAGNKLTRSEEAPLRDLEIVDIDFEGRPFILHKQAASAWRSMVTTAKTDSVELIPFSGFRSYLYQKQLIKRKLDRGKALDTILTETAIPGFSEHHSGCAVDICTDGKFALSENFEATHAFVWLTKNAGRFGFALSYPRNNDKGIVYEPWHWYFQTGSSSVE